MTMAAAFEGTAQADSWSRPHRVAAVDILSDMSRAITGDIVHVDGGFHSQGAPLGEIAGAVKP